MNAFFFITIVSIQVFVTGYTSQQYKEIILDQPFKKLTIQGNMTVILVQSSSNQKVQYYKGKINVKVNDGELVITQKGSIFKDEEPFVIIPINEITHLKIKDNAAVFTNGVIKTNQLNIDQRGDGTIRLSIDAYKVFVCCKGHGKIQIEGNYQQTGLQKDISGKLLMEYIARKK